MTDAIVCPECLKTKTRVVDSQPDYNRGSVRRRRECCWCDYRWTTYEVDVDRLNLLEDNIRSPVTQRGPRPLGARPSDRRH